MLIVPNAKELSGFGTLPPAIYRVMFASYKVKSSKAGNTMICPEFTVLSQGPDESVKTVGRKLFDNWVLCEASLGVVNSAYKALSGQDLPEGEFEEAQLVEIITNNVMGKEVLVDVRIEPGTDGKDRNVIKKYLPISA